MTKAAVKKTSSPKKVRQPSSPRILRPGDIDDASIALGQVRKLDADMRVLAAIVRQDIKDKLATLVEGQRSINADVTTIMRSLTSIERRLNAHDQQLMAANGATPPGQDR